MTALTIELTDDRTNYAPGEAVSGTVSWSAEQAGEKLELRLFWFTRGKGTEDAGIVEKIQFDRPSLHETRAFQFRLPVGPYSFSGQLISLVWALELVAGPSKTVVRREIEVGPDRREVRLEAVRSAAGPQSRLTINTR